MGIVMGQASAYPNDPLNSDEEYCPSCGEFVAQLVDETGWCFECSGIEYGFDSLKANDCARCGSELNDHTTGRYCVRCKRIIWLEKNSDAVEIVMIERQLTFFQAKDVVKALNRPICRVCENPIKGGQKGIHFFCTKTPACRRAHNAYRRNVYVKSQPRDVALREATITGKIELITGIYENGGT